MEQIKYLPVVNLQCYISMAKQLGSWHTSRIIDAEVMTKLFFLYISSICLSLDEQTLTE